MNTRCQLLATLFLFQISLLFSQNSCPGCQVGLPQNLPSDTVFLQKIADGKQFQAYSADISFRLPKTTTPVNAIDSTTPPNLPITKFKILSVTGLPAGLDWTPNKFTFETGNETDGCIKICGTPLAADSFDILVNLEATVYFLTKTASFKMKMYVAPELIINDGFTMTGFKSCGPTTVYFQNNVPSGGQNGFQYFWNFGDGTTSIAENPPSKIYSTAGIFPIKYRAEIDTSAHKLLNIRILDFSCGDFGSPISSSNPDIFMKIKDGSGALIFNSGSALSNVAPPIQIATNQNLVPGENYSLEVWDEDGALAGTDDLCGIINFSTQNAGDTLQNGDLKVVINIFHQKTIIETVDSVRVFAQPAKPLLEIFPKYKPCLGDTVTLATLQSTGNQWFMNGQPILGATNYFFQTTVAGEYRVQFTTPDGCLSKSDSVIVSFKNLPGPPVFYNNNNVLTLLNPSILPQNYELHWFRNDTLNDGDVNFDLCAPFSAIYRLEVTDLATGCTNFFESDIIINPNINCVTPTQELPVFQIKPFNLFPNPTTGEIWILTKNEGIGLAEISVFNLLGGQLGDAIFADFDKPTGVSIDLSSLPDDIYILKIRTPDGKIWAEKILLRH
jgi:Secretion system C-terminal sorting domain